MLYLPSYTQEAYATAISHKVPPCDAAKLFILNVEQGAEVIAGANRSKSFWANLKRGWQSMPPQNQQDALASFSTFLVENWSELERRFGNVYTRGAS